MTVLTFTMRFLGPFSVATGTASGGVHSTVDSDVPIPASSIKGLMRGRAAHLLGVPPSIVGAVFGHPRRPCPWAWSDPELTDQSIGRHVRIHVDADGGAVEDHVRIGEQVWATSATFDVEQIGYLSEGERRRDEVILRASARAVSSFGGGRRRGSGWVTIADGREWTDVDSRHLIDLRSPRGAA